MRINVAIPEENVKKPVLDAALEAVTRLNEDLIKSGASPTADQLIEAGAKWRPEKPGDEHFDHGALIAKRGHGDCDDWAPLKAAQLRVTGEDPEARAVVRKSGPKRWHAIVQRGDGSIDDPSLDAGMPGPAREIGVRGAWQPVMFDVHGVHGVDGAFVAMPQLALRPVADREGQPEAWQARADLPWHYEYGDSPTDIAMVSLHQSPVSSQAVVGAVLGAFELGLSSGDAHPEQLKRLSALADMCKGYSWEDVAERYGEDHATAAGQVVGSFFGKLKRLAKKAVMPLAKGALSFIPGGGLAAAALDMASPALKSSVKQAQHAPPQVRPALMQAMQRGGGGGGDNINVQLLTRWGDLLANAYDRRPAAGGWNQGAPARAPMRATFRAPPPQQRVRNVPGAAWPPRR